MPHDFRSSPQKRLIVPPSVGSRLPLTAERIKHLPVSPTLMNSLLAGLGSNISMLSRSEGDQPTVNAFPIEHEVSSLGGLEVRRSPVFHPLTSAGTQEVAYAAESSQEQETALTTININGVEKTVTSFMRWNGNNVQLFAQQRQGIQTLLPTKYNGNSGDPAMAQNPYASSGIRPQRMYIVGTDYATPTQHPAGIHVWYSDDGGSLWFSGSQLAWDEAMIVDPNGHRWLDDKPSIAVSYYPGTTGVVYATFTRIDVDSDPSLNPNQIFVLRSDDGGVTFTETAILSSIYVSPWPNYNPPSNAPQCASIAVDASTGNVFLFWLDWTTNRIYAAYSDANAATFSPIQSLDAGRLLGPAIDALPTGGGVQVRARSMLNVRANWVGHNFGVVWHARENTVNSNTDVHFAVLNADVNSLTWSGPTFGQPGVVNDSSGSGSDQWNGALDADGNGNWMISFYDRRSPEIGGSNLKYRLYATKLSFSGSRIDGADTRVTTGDPSDPRHAHFTGLYELGEYQDLWYFNGQWRGSYIYAPDNSDPIDASRYLDVYFSSIFP
jgi:hypothetical protein